MLQENESPLGVEAWKNNNNYLWFKPVKPVHLIIIAKTNVSSFRFIVFDFEDFKKSLKDLE